MFILKLSRTDGFTVKPLRMELTSYVRAGKVHVETSDDEDVTSYHLPLSDLFVNGEVRNERDVRGYVRVTSLFVSVAVQREAGAGSHFDQSDGGCSSLHPNGQAPLLLET